MAIEEISCGETFLFLRMSPSWMFVDDLRRFVESFCAASCPGADREEQLALAAHELVQNAIAYASAPGVELKLELDRETERVRVSVTNAARAEQAEVLRARIAEVGGDADPLAAYLAAMRRAPDARGGLGLPRVRFEAALELRLETSGGRVTVHAEGPLAPPDAFGVLPWGQEVPLA
jgi:anti-sigma regulatory factor (Ser/Thr protein kinase)